MYNPYNKDVNYNYSTKYGAPLYGNIDPDVWYTATQPVTFFRSFFSNTPFGIGDSEKAREGVLPSVTLEDMNKLANWSFTAPTQNDMDTYMRLSYLSQGGYSGLLGRDVDQSAKYRATLGFGANPYVDITKPLLENLPPTEVQKQSQNNPWYDYFLSQNPEMAVDPDTKEKYFVNKNGNRIKEFSPNANPAIKLDNEYVSNKDQRWKDLTKANIQDGTWYRFQKSLQAEGSLPNLLLAGVAYATKEKANTAFGVAIPGSLDQMTKELLGEVSLASYDSMLNPFNSAGLDDDIRKYLEPTPEEKINGFNSNKYWTENINPEVVPFLAQKGITPDLIASAKGSREALAKIQFALSESTIQQRMSRYNSENPWKSGIIASLGYTLPTALINDPDLALTLGLSIATLGAGTITKGGVKGLQLTASSTKAAARIEQVLQAAKQSKLVTASKGLYQISMGDLPLWFKNYGYFQKVGIGAGIAGAVNTGATYRDQLNRLSFATTGLYNNNQDEDMLSELTYSFLAGTVFGGSLGFLAHLAHPDIGGNKYTARPDLQTNALRLINDANGTEKSLLNETPKQRAALNEGIAASREEMTVREENRPPDILESTKENVQPNSIEVIDQRGNRIRVQEEDITPIAEVSEKILSGEYKVVRDQKNKTDVAIRSELNPITEKPRVVSEEVPLSAAEKHVVDSEKFADAADTARRASAGTLAEATDSTALDRTAGESDISFATRLVRGNGVRNLSDLFKITQDKSSSQKSMAGKLVQFKRQVESIKTTLNEVLKNESITKERAAEVRALLPKLDEFTSKDIDVRLRKTFEDGSDGFKKLSAQKQKELIDFVMEHAGKTDEQIDEVLKNAGDKFAKNEKQMLARRLKEKKTRVQRRKLIDEILSDNSISDQSRKILNTLLGTPENLTLIQRKLASGAYRKEKYFLKKASYLTGEFYLDFKDILNQSLNTLTLGNKAAAKANADLISGLVRSALVNLRLPERAGLNKIELSIEELKNGTFGSNKLVTKADGSTVLQITLDSKTLMRALETGDNTLIAHTVLHELGHAYSYFATPTDILRMLTMYSEFLDPDVLDSFVNITEATRGGQAGGVGMYAAINPGEVFANHFANQGLVTGLDSAAKLKLSFLEAFGTYVSDIIDGIADTFTFNNTTKLKLKRISKVINEVIENISTTKPNAITLIDMVKEERDFAESLRKASFYSTDKKEYQKNIIDLIKKHLPTPSEINDYNSGINSWLLGIEQGVYSYGSIGLNRGDRYTGISDQLIRNIQLANDDIKFPPYLDNIQTLDILLNPENTLAQQLAGSNRNPDVIKNIIKTAELTSTRVGLERYLRTNNLATLRSIDDLNAFIKTQGSYVSASLNRYLSTFLFDLNRISENVFRLEELNSKAKQKSILRQNVFELSSGQQVFRPKFDTGLDDTSLVLYHGGSWTGGKAPNMLHSGTLKAAFDRTKHSLGSDINYNIVAFEISKESNIIEMIDTGTNHVTFESYWDAIIQAYDNKPDLRFKDIVRDIIVDKKKADEIVTKLEKIYQEDINLPPNSVDTIKTILKEAGVDIIKYKNVGEDVGSTSFVIVNPNSISVKANGKFEPDGTWAWRSRSTGKLLESTTRDLHDINYRGSESLQNLIKVVPGLKGLESDFSEAIGVQKEVEFKPTSITEVTPETKPLLEQELNNLLIKIEGFKPSFFRRLAGAVRATTTLSISPEDAKSTLTDIWFASKKQLDKGEIPTILTKKTEKEIFSLVVGFKKNISFKELESRAKGGKVGELDSFQDVDVIAGQANKNNETIDGEATDIDALRKRLSDFSNFLNNNIPIFSGNVVNEIQELMRIRLEYSKLTKGFKSGKTPKLPAGAGLELYFRIFPEERAVYNNYLKLKNEKISPNMVEVLYGQDKNKIQLKKEDIVTAYKDGYVLLFDPKNELIMGYIENNKLEATLKENSTTKIDEAIKQIKSKATALLTRVQKQEKIALEEFKDMVPSERPIHTEKMLYDATLEKVAKSEDSAIDTQQAKVENQVKDQVQLEENKVALTSKEEKPEIAAPVIKGIGNKESFISSDWDGDPNKLELGVIFTNEKRAANIKKKQSSKHTVRVELDKSKVFKVVSAGTSAYQAIKNLPEPILRIAGINKSTMERVLNAVTKEHSEQEAFRVILNKLNEEGYTAVEFIDLKGNLIGHSPTSKDHVKVIEALNHEETKPVGYVSLDAARKKKVAEPKPTAKPEPESIRVEPETPIDPTETVVPVSKTGEPDVETAPITKGESDIPVISEEEKFVHEVLNASETLRWNGTTPKIIRLALVKFMSTAKELRENIGVDLIGIPEEFKGLLYKVVRVAEEIAEENRTRFGDLYESINNEFWTIFDREVAKEILHRSKPDGELSVKTIGEIIEFAHQKINENIAIKNKRDGTSLPEFLKPISPDEFEFTSSKITNKMPDDVKFKKGSLANSMDKRIEKRLEDASKAPEEKAPEIKEPEEDEVADAVLGSINSNPKDNTMLLRESNWISAVFGGSQRDGRNWWRKLMNGLVNVIEVRAQTAYTARSLSNIVRTISAFADNSKAHIHNLVGGGKNAIKSWEQCSHETWRMLSGIRNSATNLAQSLGNERIYSLISIEIMKSFATKTPLDRAKLEAVIRTVIPTPSAEYLNTNILNITSLHNAVAEVNKTLLDLETETGFIKKGVSLVDKDGKPVKPTDYYPITFVGELVTRENEDAVIKEMVRVRTETLNASDKLDNTVMLSMGWFYNKEGYILDRGRKLEGRQQFFLNEADFDTQTLINLEERRYPPGTDPKTMIEFRGEASNRHFTYKDTTTKEVVVCRLPREKTDLSAVDLVKYNETVMGSNAHVGKQWKANFTNKMTVVELMMQDLLHSKLYRGKYSKDLATRKGNATTPMLALTDNARLEHGSVIPTLTWEEILASDTITKIMRHEPLEAYSNFVVSRGFELLVQKEIDRLTGLKGVRMGNFMRILYNKAREEAYALGGEKRAKEIGDGFDRLSNDYLAYQNRLSMIQTRSESVATEATEIGLGLVRAISGTLWGITGSAEPLQHLILSPFTVGPMQTIKNIWESVRILIGDKRFSTSAALRDEMMESVFFMDLVRSDVQDRLLNIDGDGVPRISRWFDRLKARREDSSALGKGVDIFANTMVEIGSSRYTTFLARKLAMQRFSTRFAKFINNGAAEKFFTKLSDPVVQARMRSLEEAAATDIKAAKELDKMFKEISRQTGFGGRWDVAMAMNKYGINTVDRIRALKKMFDKLGPQYSKSGLINWKEFRTLVDELKKTPVIRDLDYDVARDAYESLIFATESMVTTEGAISSSRGLNRDLRIEGRTPTGRLLKSLLGWSQSFYNNVLGNHGGIKSSALIGSMILYTGLTAISEYMKEWIRGRDWEDIKEEMKKDPETFIYRMMMNLPALGGLSGNLQYVLAKTSEATGGPLRAFRSPMMAPAYSMAMQQPFKMANSLYNLVTNSIPSGDMAATMEDLGSVTMVNNLFNNSPVAIPARLLVENKFITEGDALGKYMKLINKTKNTYKKGSKYNGPSFVQDDETMKRLVAEIVRRRSQSK